LFPSCSSWGCGPGKSRLDDRSAHIFAEATKVEAFRIDGGGPARKPKVTAPGDPVLDGYAILDRGKDQGPEFARKLAAILSDPSLDSTARAKCFWPGVAFRVWKGEECVDVLICFYCHNFYLGPPSDKQVINTGHFTGSPAAPRLVRLVKEALPDDKDIQVLEENR
jgi:hypothetical protein